MLLSKFAYANFVWIFMSLRALPLKIPQGALPLDPTTFEKVDKTFMFLAMAGYSETGRSESQKFLSNFFQKVCGFQRKKAFGQGFQGRSPLKPPIQVEIISEKYLHNVQSGQRFCLWGVWRN